MSEERRKQWSEMDLLEKAKYSSWYLLLRTTDHIWLDKYFSITTRIECEAVLRMLQQSIPAVRKKES